MDLKHYKTDLKKEDEGVWQTLDNDVELLIASSGSLAYKKALKKAANRFKGPALELLPINKQEEIFAKVMAETVLLDWRETVDGKVRAHTVTVDSKAVKYSPEAAFEILKECRSIFTVVLMYAQADEMYREQAIEEAEGNSPAA